MDKLRISLSQAAAEGLTVEAEVSCAELRPEDAPGLDVSGVKVRAELTESGNEYVFQGRVSGVFHHVCDRCLEAADTPFRAEMARVFVRGGAAPASDDEDDGEDGQDLGIVFFEGDEIDLRPVVWEEIVLAAPAKFLCKEDCAGLCPVCGANWNRAACSCEEKRAMRNTGLSGLADLFPGLRPKHPEE